MENLGERDNIVIDGEKIKRMEKFCYLGVIDCEVGVGKVGWTER